MNTDSQVKKEKGSCHLYVYPFGLEQMDLDQQIKFINRIGFRGFAWEGTDQSTKTRIEDFYSSRLTIENNLKIAGIYFFYNLDHQDEPQAAALSGSAGRDGRMPSRWQIA